MSADFNQDYFDLFGLPHRFRIDSPALDRAWRAISAEVHPDRHAHAGEADKRAALMLTTRVNEAYRTLKTPVARARYLLSLQGVDTKEDTNTSMPMDFLMAQIEWREAIEDAQTSRNTAQLEKLGGDLDKESATMEAELAIALDDEHNLDSAAILVRKLRFMEKLGQEIEDAIEDALS